MVIVTYFTHLVTRFYLNKKNLNNQIIDIESVFKWKANFVYEKRIENTTKIL